MLHQFPLLFSCILLTSFSFSDVLSSSTQGPIVDVGSAQFQGVFDPNTNVTNFLGIRYASPPTGNLRFRAPQPPAPISGVQQVDTEPPECVQGLVTDSEDCLFLNVHIPGNHVTATPSLPTVVWIHGGGYAGGNGSSFHGSDLLQEASNEVVAVVIQYRLGLFGFLAGKNVKENGDLNAGLLDQHLALKWVNEHIAKFGGDPEKVTIWGESAGAGSVLQHVVAQDGQTSPPLFRSAITSSTFLPSQYPFDDVIPESLYTEVVSQSNCASASDTLACLRDADISVLRTVNSNIQGAIFFGTFAFVPVIDGSFITQRPTIALREGKINGHALLAVTNMNEGPLFVDQTGVIMNTSIYAGQLFPKFSVEQENEVAKQYAGLGTTLDQINDIMGDSIFKCPSFYLLSAFHAHGFNTFKGEFAIPPAFHGMDVNYYFPSSGPISFQNPAFSAAFSQSFLSFVISVDPNDKVDPQEDITPPWLMFPAADTEMVFNKTAVGNGTDIHPVRVSNSLLERCNFWESVGALTGQ
ncbi:Alpha/Beta hydrolase protein [Lentinula aciculospora]|uniref:Carboxylic ester hydrolase n=1 Tax=Lentinula aciculospora TaxID=153920 RepID=A0A9W9AEL5_9AGAR|nr:Alpha/Beta hydrolase protein [Lentinula aciculospora]